ncbi:MAG: hypothetical protein WBP42_05965 [Candidatus Zixiibacteriota bacterium]
MKLREQMQQWYVRMKSRECRMVAYEFPGSIRGSKRIVVTLPSGIQTNSVLLRMIGELPVIFPSSDLMVVVPSGCTEVARKTGIHAISPDLYAANFIGLPKKDFFRKVADFDASVFIDFETHKNIFNALVAIASGAGLRIGLAGVWGAPIHNFEIRSSFQHDELKVYRSMVDLLSSIQISSVMPDFRESN